MCGGRQTTTRKGTTHIPAETSHTPTKDADDRQKRATGIGARFERLVCLSRPKMVRIPLSETC